MLVPLDCAGSLRRCVDLRDPEGVCAYEVFLLMLFSLGERRLDDE